MSISWQGKIVERLKFHFADGGLSQAAIAEKLRAEGFGDITSNMIAGVVHRLKLGRPIGPHKVVRLQPKSKAITSYRHSSQPKPPQSVVGPPKGKHEPDPIGPRNDFPLAGHCRFTRDDPAKHNWRMCGQKTPAFDDPWCDYHRRIIIGGHQQQGVA